MHQRIGILLCSVFAIGFGLTACHVQAPTPFRALHVLPKPTPPLSAQYRFLRHSFAGYPVEIRSEDKHLRIVLPVNTNFIPKNSTLSKPIMPYLNIIVTLLRRYPHTIVVAHGYSDNHGEHDVNQALSERRAHAVLAYFALHGIHPQRLRAIGYGESDPVASNADEAGRALNRRVELTIHIPRHHVRLRD